jgi:hypothetical protein
MTILIAAETLVLILLAVLVVALLRSHAEILRRLDRGHEGAGDDVPPGRMTPGMARPRSREGALAAVDVTGHDLAGDAVQVGLGAGGPPTLIAFLSSGCLTCHGFWRSFDSADRPAIPGGGRLVIVTKDSAHESPARLRELAPEGVPLVMSTAAWESYEVPTAPYFVYVDGASGEIAGEGAASGWQQVVSLLRDALDDEATERGRSAGSGAARANRIELDLERAGIHPGHPSLYPGTLPPEGER